MSKGLYQATAEEVAALLVLVDQADWHTLNVISTWVTLSEKDQDRAARPEIFIDYIRDLIRLQRSGIV
jgi:hypothetical protein